MTPEMLREEMRQNHVRHDAFEVLERTPPLGRLNALRLPGRPADLLPSGSRPDALRFPRARPRAIRKTGLEGERP